MQVDSTTAYVAPAPQVAYVLCADCGTPIEPNTAGLCVNCLRNTIDITEDIPKQVTIQYCRNCSRYLLPPQSWVLAELESVELMSVCLRRLTKLNKVRLLEPRFLWTEPHSKRLRLKLTVQKEVLAGTVLQQTFEVEYIIQHTQCPQCARLAAKNTWRALVQVRQKVDHKRTFLFLEQIILKHNADRDTVGIKEAKDGIDFFYATRSHAVKMVDFLQACMPAKTKASEKLISADEQNGTANYKYTYSVELVPVCKDDLVCLPLKLARSLANVPQLLLCNRVNNAVHLIDPLSLQTVTLQGFVYWRDPFPPLASVSRCIEFVVLDVEPVSYTGPSLHSQHSNRFALADAQVSPLASSMDSDAIYTVRTHLGAVLKPGDTCLGYLVAASNFNHDAFDRLDPDRVPEVILVRKTYPNRRKKNRPRNWRLRSIAKEAADGEHAGLGRAAAAGESKGGRGGADAARQAEAEYEMFLRDLEEDREMRSAVQLIKANEPMSNGRPTTGAAERRRARENAMAVDESGQEAADVDMSGEADLESGTEADDEEDFPEVQLEEMMDELEALRIRDEAKHDEDGQEGL